MHLNQVVVPLPTKPRPINATLFYDADFSKGNHRLDYLHIIKDGTFFRSRVQPFDPDTFEEEYWVNLEAYRHQFAASIPGSYDLLADPPSTSGYHRPFISAYKRKEPKLQWVYFWKNKPVKADITKMDELRAVVVLTDMRENGSFNKVPPGKCKRLIIVDDVYATGVTAAAMVEILWQKGLSQDVEVTIACPLRVPQVPKKAAGDLIFPEDLPKD